VRLALCLAAVLFLVAATSALAATPAQQFAKQLKRSMQTYYNRADPGLKITTVTCRVAKNDRTGRCNARFTRASQRARGLFVIGVTIDPATGNVKTKTLSAACTDSKTHKKISCF
jgi:hypothetical protein